MNKWPWNLVSELCIRSYYTWVKEEVSDWTFQLMNLLPCNSEQVFEGVWSMPFSASSLISCIKPKLFFKVILLWYLWAFLHHLEGRQEPATNVKRLQCCGFPVFCICPWQSQSVCHYFNYSNHQSSFLFWIHLNALKKTFPKSKLGCLISVLEYRCSV